MLKLKMLRLSRAPGSNFIQYIVLGDGKEGSPPLEDIPMTHVLFNKDVKPSNVSVELSNDGLENMIIKNMFRNTVYNGVLESFINFCDKKWYLEIL